MKIKISINKVSKHVQDIYLLTIKKYNNLKKVVWLSKLYQKYIY